MGWKGVGPVLPICNGDGRTTEIVSVLSCFQPAKYGSRMLTIGKAKGEVVSMTSKVESVCFRRCFSRDGGVGMSSSLFHRCYVVAVPAFKILIHRC